MPSRPTPARTRTAEAAAAPIDVAGVATPRENDGLSNKRRKETTDLRAMLADVVLEYTTLKRREQIRMGNKPEYCQEIIENYDPVVAMALLGVSTGDPSIALQAHANVAKFVRPQLKSVETIGDTEKVAELTRRSEMAAVTFAMIDDIARRRRMDHDDTVRERGVILDQPEGK